MRSGLHLVDCNTWKSWSLRSLLAFDTIRAQCWIPQLSGVEYVISRVPGAIRRVRDKEGLQCCDLSRARNSELTTPTGSNFAFNVCDTRVIVWFDCCDARRLSSLASDPPETTGCCFRVRVGASEISHCLQEIEVIRFLVVDKRNLITPDNTCTSEAHHMWCSGVWDRRSSVFSHMSTFHDSRQ